MLNTLLTRVRLLLHATVPVRDDEVIPEDEGEAWRVGERPEPVSFSPPPPPLPFHARRKTTETFGASPGPFNLAATGASAAGSAAVGSAAPPETGDEEAEWAAIIARAKAPAPPPADSAGTPAAASPEADEWAAAVARAKAQPQERAPDEEAEWAAVMARAKARATAHVQGKPTPRPALRIVSSTRGRPPTPAPRVGPPPPPRKRAASERDDGKA
jgi:hypothetical protein